MAELKYPPSEFMGKKVDFDKAKAVVVPVPYASSKRTENTKNAPREILLNWNMEEYDLSLGYEPSSVGIYPMPEVSYEGLMPEEAIRRIRKAALEIKTKDKFPIFLGGDHSITIGTTKAYKDISVLTFDGHADLKNEYMGDKYSHACAIRRVMDAHPTIQIGIRSLGKDEIEVARKLDTYATIDEKEFEEILEKLKENVYIDIDLDVFDPSIMPATELPEPDGIFWNELMEILKYVFKEKNIVGCSISELSPIENFNAPNVLCAQLAYKLIGLKFQPREEREE